MAPAYSLVQPTEGGAGMILTGVMVNMLGYTSTSPLETLSGFAPTETSPAEVVFIVLAVTLSVLFLSSRGANRTHTHLYLPAVRGGLTHAVGATSRAKCPHCRTEAGKVTVGVCSSAMSNAIHGRLLTFDLTESLIMFTLV